MSPPKQRRSEAATKRRVVEWPRFMGLTPEQADPDRAAAAVLPVPYDATSTWMKGAGEGPRALLEASTAVELFDIETESEPWTRGIATLPPIEFSGPPTELAEVVSGATAEILGRGQLPIVLGGEHSVSIGAVQATARRFPGLCVLQLDAHADTRETYEGSTHNHACVMARVRESCPIVQVGIRSLDAAEWPMLDRRRVVFAHEIAADRDRRWINRVVDLLGAEVYVTIDLDVFDPALLPATGTPEPGGLSWYDVMALLDTLTRRRCVVAFDVVELCPAPGQHASAFTAAKLVYRFLSLIWR